MPPTTHHHIASSHTEATGGHRRPHAAPGCTFTARVGNRPTPTSECGLRQTIGLIPTWPDIYKYISEGNFGTTPLGLRMAYPMPLDMGLGQGVSHHTDATGAKADFDGILTKRKKSSQKKEIGFHREANDHDQHLVRPMGADGHTILRQRDSHHGNRDDQHLIRPMGADGRHRAACIFEDPFTNPQSQPVTLILYQFFQNVGVKWHLVRPMAEYWEPKEE